jgi:hypothetical protein
MSLHGLEARVQSNARVNFGSISISEKPEENQKQPAVDTTRVMEITRLNSGALLLINF